MKHIFQNENEVWYFCHLNMCIPTLFWLFSHLFHPLVHLGVSYWILLFSNNNNFQFIDLICGGLLHLLPIFQCVFNFKPAVWVLSFWLLGFASPESPGSRWWCAKTMVYDHHILHMYISQKWLLIMFLTIGGASRKRGAGSSSTHEDLKLGEKPAGGIASLKKRLITSSFF